MSFLLRAFLLLLCIAKAPPSTAQQWQQIHVWPGTLWIGLDFDQEGTLWLSGTNNRIAYRLAGADTFYHFQNQQSDSLQFRDIAGLGGGRAVVMSAGQGAASRLFVFDGIQGLEERFRVQEAGGFLDAIAFWDGQRGLAYGDALDEALYLLATEDGGQHWQRIDPQSLPTALPGEGGFAASGSCLQLRAGGGVLIGAQSQHQSRVFMGEHYGQGAWRVWDSPFPGGEMTGITSLRFRDNWIYLAGGALNRKDQQENFMRWNPDKDTSQAWRIADLAGAYYCLALGAQGQWAVSGPAGAAFTADSGQSWRQISNQPCWTCTFFQGAFYFAGGGGGVYRFRP